MNVSYCRKNNILTFKIHKSTFYAMENTLDEAGVLDEEEFNCFWDMVDEGRAAINSTQEDNPDIRGPF